MKNQEKKNLKIPECSTDISFPFIFIPDNFSMALSSATLSCKSTNAKPRLLRTMLDTSICFSLLFVLLILKLVGQRDQTQILKTSNF